MEIYTPIEREQMLKLARRVISAATCNEQAPEAESIISEKLSEKKGCFVTLTDSGNLRGCIGFIFPEMPLIQAIIENARGAAIHDPRFMPVKGNELDKLRIEISVLSVPAPLAFSSPDDLLSKLRPHVDGVVLDLHGRRSTFLPQVWEQLPNGADFLSALSQKAGLRADAWRDQRMKILTYQVEAFHE